MTQDWVASFDEAYHNAVIYGTGFIRVTANGPEGLNLSVVDPKDYRYLMEEPPSTWTGLTDEEISTVEYNNHPLDGIRSFARAIEAKLKEKNT